MTKIQKWWASITGIITILLTIAGSVTGIFSDFTDWVVEREERKENEVRIMNMLTDWELARKYMGKPLDVQEMYDERGILIDSIEFDVQQLNNLAWASMEKYHITDSCGTQCRYWFRKDIHGTIWYRDKIVINGIREFTHLYTVTWNATVGKWEYTDWSEEKQFIPHKWELENNNN